MSKYKHLVGKWVKVVHPIDGADVGKWVQIEKSDGDDRLVVVFREGMGLSEGARNWHFTRFNINHPMDYNPDEAQQHEPPTLKVDNYTMQPLSITDELVVKSAIVNPSTFVMGSPLNELVVNFEGYTLTVEGKRATFTKAGK